ncbi:MAG TPA: LacI family DNA-binding transcriptional regulator [Candidatus Methylomirabilis sp.]|nr:LacI family DNA-binding transcriptional regulator [Candidatus Methylomirabilis sp.]
MVTIKDVAREAGVSVGTASQALRGSAVVRETTRGRVLAVATRLRYQPSALARGLVTRRTHTVGLLISDIANPFFIRAVRAVEDVAQENGYNVILCNTDEEPAKETRYLRVLMEKRVDGIILATTAASLRMVRDIRWRRIPLVLFDRELPGATADIVKVDGVLGGRLATEHLLDFGHRRIAIIHGPLVRSTGGERLEGYLTALRAADVRPDPALIHEGNFKQDSGRELTRRLLELSPRPTALFCTNNLMTVGALQALREGRVRIPEDLSLVGYDDMEWWTLTQPPLTAVGQPVYDLGREAMRLLLAQIARKTARRPQRVVLKPELVLRDSCGAPPRLVRAPGSRRRTPGLQPKEGHP